MLWERRKHSTGCSPLNPPGRCKSFYAKSKWSDFKVEIKKNQKAVHETMKTGEKVEDQTSYFS